MAETSQNSDAANDQDNDQSQDQNKDQSQDQQQDQDSSQNKDQSADQQGNKSADKKDDSKGYWPEDWRNKYVEKMPEGEERDKMIGRLNRYASPQAAIDALIAAQNKIASGKYKEPLGEKPTAEELTAWRKENGIPESAKEYEIKLGEGFVIGDDDKEMVDSFLEVAHSKNYTPEQVNQVLNWYYQRQEAAYEKQYEADRTFKAGAEEELRAEYGAEYKSNLNLLSNFLDTAGEGVAEIITQARAADGTPLANHPGVIRFFIDKAKEANPMSTVVPGSGEKAMTAVMDEIKALEAEIGTDAWYKDDAKQKRYQALVTARDSQKKK